MYLDHFGLHEAPFRITPHTEFFFAGAKRGATLDALIYAILHDEGIVKVSGEVGSGKTMLCRVLLERLPQTVRTVYLANPTLSREDILFTIAEELHLEPPTQARPAAILRLLQEHLVESFEAGSQVVILIDEAHAMPVDTLEEVRLLSNLETKRNKLLQLVLFGQPELDETLARADMRQLKERITHNFALEPLLREDVSSYIEFRMRAAGYKGPQVFTPAAIRRIAGISMGLTRRVNILADKALLAAYAEGSHQVGPREIEAAVRDTEFSPALGSRRSTIAGMQRIVIPAFVALIVGAGVTYWSMRGQALDRPVATQPASAESHAAPSQPAASASAPDLKFPAQAYAAPRAGATTEQAYRTGEQWLRDAPADRWFVQLLRVGDEPATVNAYLRIVPPALIESGMVRAYRVSFGDKKLRLGVIYGDYATAEEANQALASLPQELRIGQPFVRQVQKLR